MFDVLYRLILHRAGQDYGPALRASLCVGALALVVVALPLLALRWWLTRPDEPGPPPPGPPPH